MTTTAQDIVRGALILIGVIDVGGAIPASEAADGLAALNDMIQSWESMGVSTGVGELELTDPTPFEDMHTKWIKNILAMELAGNYGKDVPPRVAQDAVQGWQIIQSDFRVVETLQVDSALRCMPTQRRSSGW